MTEKEFAQVYLDSLSKKYPSVKFELNPDLTITSKKGDSDYKHYIDNAFIAYKAEPDSINDIISRYVASTTELYIDQKLVNVGNVVPVIKSVEFLDEINSLSKDGKSFPVITEKYNDQLIIVYAEDSKNSIKFLTEDDFKTLSISRDTLKSIALKNFDKRITKIQRQGDYGLFMITAGGDYEASLILLSSIWTKESFPVDGDFIIAIPNRDMLMVTGSKNKTGIAKIKEIVADSYKTGNYQVSDKLYKWTGSKFEKY
ncbi:MULTISPECIES: DUF1444 family protein [unclassified Arcicella]|uniref:DUF1444 family protein n=1 Tax=unclassified Arcicella TaxID=2644986 RepID=UPI00285814A6|nr:MULTISPECIES: DUF1444 family protein [unclassified Arcicella]MDR6561554.1 uncharacterized protein YtpQ (UPF0354 family) [Arcicella sp. BE51]MDR6811438.1 uncharacterized protein YtpQ (UPF0354 family) [Arcicella sp. BE140]MDR6822788.1 uncharacterized protein YtpQ (UPF0354 family) [Arcicella sp. BE139]